ncbi:MAG: MYXO-CTERM sorting domain-containing protein [Polyangiaceae bacterium]
MKHTLRALLAVCTFGALAHAAPNFASQKPGTWQVISENTIDDLDPCPAGGCSFSAVEGVSGTIDDWCGGAFASGYGTLGGLVVWGGGHNGYFGSEVYVFDLQTGLWKAASKPYDNGGSSVAPECNDKGVYPDGSACPAHTYDRVDYHPSTNQFVIMSGTPDPVCGGCDDGYVHTFDLGTAKWSLGGKIPNMQPATGALSAYDPKRDVFWYLSAYGASPLRKYDLKVGAWSEHGSAADYVDIDGNAIYDPVHDLFLYVDARGSHELYAFDLANPSADGVKLATSGDTDIMNADKLGFEWDPPSGQAVAWDDGADVYVLEAPSGDWKSGTWTWTRFPPDASNTVVPKRGLNGTYSRFRYAASVNAYVLVSTTGGPVWAYKLSDEPGTGPNTGTGGTSSGSGGAGGAGNSAGAGNNAGTGNGGAAGGGGLSATPSNEEDSGCACRTAAPSGSSSAWSSLLLLAALSLLRRRRASLHLGTGEPQ